MADALPSKFIKQCHQCKFGAHGGFLTKPSQIQGVPKNALSGEGSSLTRSTVSEKGSLFSKVFGIIKYSLFWPPLCIIALCDVVPNDTVIFNFSTKVLLEENIIR